MSVITGTRPYEKLAIRNRKPCVITGFEPSDIIKGIERLIRKIKDKDYTVEIEYKRAVKKEGNKTARGVLDSVFKVDDAEWRGFGTIKNSALKLKNAYKNFNAEENFPVKIPASRKKQHCICGELMQGLRSPKDCKLFRKACTPRSPVGPCMVSSEGTCAAYYRYG